MTIEEFYCECDKRGYRTMTVGGKKTIVNPVNKQDFPMPEDVFGDLVAFHGEEAGTDLLKSGLQILESGLDES